MTDKNNFIIEFSLIVSVNGSVQDQGAPIKKNHAVALTLLYYNFNM